MFPPPFLPPLSRRQLCYLVSLGIKKTKTLKQGRGGGSQGLIYDKITFFLPDVHWWYSLALNFFLQGFGALSGLGLAAFPPCSAGLGLGHGPFYCRAEPHPFPPDGAGPLCGARLGSGDTHPPTGMSHASFPLHGAGSRSFFLWGCIGAMAGLPPHLLSMQPDGARCACPGTRLGT